MNKTKIEWCDSTWNPVWGCHNNCPYCYARKIAKRFYMNVADKHNNIDLIKQFKPVWIESNFNKPFPKKPSRIFVNSMSDIEYWNPEWMNKVLGKIKANPQHIFLFLTKNPDVYHRYFFIRNCWIGITITNQLQMDRLGDYVLFSYAYNNKCKIFLSVEPMQGEIKLKVKPDWIIIGAETGNRKDKIATNYEWVAKLGEKAMHYRIPVFMKNSLKNTWIGKLKQDFPEESE